MSIPVSIKRQACEGLLHSYPKKTLARELNISCGAIRDWSIFVEHDFFDWVNKPCVGQRKHQLAGLVTSRRVGKEVFYRAADTEPVRAMHRMIEDVMHLSCMQHRLE